MKAILVGAAMVGLATTTAGAAEPDSASANYIRRKSRMQHLGHRPRAKSRYGSRHFIQRGHQLLSIES
jgi:hypothetical protein